MHIWEEKGIALDFSRDNETGEKWFIDPMRKRIEANRVIVSHAHSDHVSIGAQNEFPYIMTEATHALIGKNIPPNAKTKTIRLGKSFQAGGQKVSLVSAGHITGSAQIVIEGEKKICATTDFKLQDSILQKGAEIVDCDVLIMEATFGKDQFHFPAREETYQRMGKWIAEAQEKNMLPVLAGYATGKAQELTKIVNEYSRATPYVHDSIFDKNKAHDAHDKKLGDYVKIDNNLKEAELLIIPPSWCSPHVLQAISVSAKRPIISGKCTGWGWRESYDELFPLSDHADFDQLLSYVKQASPKRVFTHHGFEHELAAAITKHTHIPASPLRKSGRADLSVFG